MSTITAQELNDNYYLACIVYLCPSGTYVANDPSTGQKWNFVLMDDGSEAPVPPCESPHPNPHIYSWDVLSAAQPTNDTLMLATMAQIDAAHAALYFPAEASEVKALRGEVKELSAALAKVLVILEQSRPQWDGPSVQGASSASGAPSAPGSARPSGPALASAQGALKKDGPKSAGSSRKPT